MPGLLNPVAVVVAVIAAIQVLKNIINEQPKRI